MVPGVPFVAKEATLPPSGLTEDAEEVANGVLFNVCCCFYNKSVLGIDGRGIRKGAHRKPKDNDLFAYGVTGIVH